MLFHMSFDVVRLALRQELSRVIDQIPTRRDSNSVWVRFLGTVVNDNTGVSNSLIFLEC